MQSEFVIQLRTLTEREFNTDKATLEVDYTPIPHPAPSNQMLE
jgi:hypothetical protein